MFFSKLGTTKITIQEKKVINKTKQRFRTKIENTGKQFNRQHEIWFDGVALMMYRKKSVTVTQTTFMIRLSPTTIRNDNAIFIKFDISDCIILFNLFSTLLQNIVVFKKNNFFFFSKFHWFPKIASMGIFIFACLVQNELKPYSALRL